MIKCVSKTSFASLLLQNCVVLRSNKNTIFKRLTTVAMAAAIIRYITNALDKRVFRMMTLQKCTCIRYRLINCDESRRSIESDMGWTMGQIHCNAKIKSKLRASYAGPSFGFLLLSVAALKWCDWQRSTNKFYYGVFFSPCVSLVYWLLSDFDWELAFYWCSNWSICACEKSINAFHEKVLDLKIDNKSGLLGIFLRAADFTNVKN